MNSVHLPAVCWLALMLCGVPHAQVTVSDSGVHTVTIHPGAPAHTVGLQGLRHEITMDTGATTYGVRYVVALHPDDPKAAIPGEGYIGMSRPVDSNWYTGGFFDLQLNGKSIGNTLIHSLTARSSDNRGTADFVFDTEMAMVRIRFVVQTGGDCLYAQVLLEPKQEITSVRLVTRCYPSGWITNSDRHVRTASRDFAQGERADLDVDDEWWTLYYDSVYEAGYIGPVRRGVGPCAMLWLPEQTREVGFSVGSYGVETPLDLDPELRDFRFVFFDYAGKKNDIARADLERRADAVREELASFSFTDPSIARWPLAQKQAEARQALEAVPDDEDAAAQYARWGEELAEQLRVLNAGPAGAIEAEANAARLIAEWERGLPELKLQALLNTI